MYACIRSMLCTLAPSPSHADHVHPLSVSPYLLQAEAWCHGKGKQYFLGGCTEASMHIGIIRPAPHCSLLGTSQQGNP